MQLATTLETARLRLRPLLREDADSVQVLVSDRAIADTTLNILHPYPEGGATEWIVAQQLRCEAGELVNFAMVSKDAEQLIGVAGFINVNSRSQRGELGYWVGKPFWNRGYATEAVQALLTYAFGTLNLHRVHGSVFKRNPASRRVFEKNGLSYEGCWRAHEKKWDQYEDVLVYGILKGEWDRK
jgi:[ribosomal protein S5]-alanine N-acetyltransferase